MATAAQRQHLLALMKFLLAHEPQIHYAELRPMRTIHYTATEVETLLKLGRSITMDCSEAVTCLCKWAGLHDPNGMHYNGSGFTGTMLDHLSHYSDPAKAHIGALCVFGPYPGDHVCMVMARGADPLLWSHGAEAGPRKVPYSVEKAIHRKPATFLSITPL